MCISLWTSKISGQCVDEASPRAIENVHCVQGTAQRISAPRARSRACCVFGACWFELTYKLVGICVIYSIKCVCNFTGTLDGIKGA